MARQPMQTVQRSYTSEFSVVSPELESLEFGVVFGEEGVVGVVELAVE
jgi:hypothetical protein